MQGRNEKDNHDNIDLTQLELLTGLISTLQEKESAANKSIQQLRFALNNAKNEYEKQHAQDENEINTLNEKLGQQFQEIDKLKKYIKKLVKFEKETTHLMTSLNSEKSQHAYTNEKLIQTRRMLTEAQERINTLENTLTQQRSSESGRGNNTSFFDAKSQSKLGRRH